MGLVGFFLEMSIHLNGTTHGVNGIRSKQRCWSLPYSSQWATQRVGPCPHHPSSSPCCYKVAFWPPLVTGHIEFGEGATSFLQSETAIFAPAVNGLTFRSGICNPDVVHLFPFAHSPLRSIVFPAWWDFLWSWKVFTVVKGETIHTDSGVEVWPHSHSCPISLKVL